jgi:hypothetical protein
LGPEHAQRGSSVSSLGFLNSTADTISNFFSSSGGLHECWDRRALSLLGQDTCRFDRSVPLARQGASALRLDAAELWGRGWQLVVFNCHFTIMGGEEARASNLRDLVRFMRRFLAAELPADSTSHPRAVVLLCGDLNVGPQLSGAAASSTDAAAAGGGLVQRGAGEYSRVCTLAGAGSVRDCFGPEAGPTLRGPAVRNHHEEGDGSNSYFPWPFTGKADHVLVVESLCMGEDVVVAEGEGAGDGDGDDDDDDGAGDGGASADGARWEFADVEVARSSVLRQPYGEEMSDHDGLLVELRPR